MRRTSDRCVDWVLHERLLSLEKRQTSFVNSSWQVHKNTPTQERFDRPTPFKCGWVNGLAAIPTLLSMIVFCLIRGQEDRRLEYEKGQNRNTRCKDGKKG